MEIGQVFNFKYFEFVAGQYRYKGVVENNNALRHYGRNKSQVGLASSWGTTWLPIQVFAFFVACTEVNTYITTKLKPLCFQNCEQCVHN